MCSHWEHCTSATSFFTRNDSRAMRIGFVAAAVGFYFLFICFYAVFLFMNEPAQPA